MTPGLAVFLKLTFGFVGVACLLHLAPITMVGALEEWRRGHSLPHLIYGIGATVFLVLLAAWLITVQVKYLDRLLEG